MENSLERPFLDEIEHQCKVVITSYNDLIANINAMDSVRAWTSIQSILIACANISKIFAPPNPKDRSLGMECKQRGEDLMKKLSLNDTSPLLSRDLRNHFEHFDERLHTWAKASPIFVHRNIAPAGAIQIGDNPPSKSFMANFDPNTLVLTFWGDTFNISEIINDVVTLLQNTQNELQKLNSPNL